MPVEVRCKFCDWVFNVADQMAGGTCRCKHCAQINSVPLMPGTRELTRPMSPPRRKAQVDPVTAAPKGVLSEIGRRMSIRRWFGIAAVAVLAIAVGIWAIVARTPTGGDTVPVKLGPALVQISARDVARVPADSVVSGLPKTFCDIASTAPRSAWIVDGSATMRPYYADITTLIATAIAGLSPTEQQAGIVLAKADGMDSISMRAPLGPMQEAVRNTMRAFAPGGATPLLKAMQAALEWKPDVVFLVVAQPSDFVPKSEFVRLALAARSAVHVIALGEERLLGWAFLAKGTGGQFQALDSRELQQRVYEVMGKPDEGPFSPPRLRRGE